MAASYWSSAKTDTGRFLCDAYELAEQSGPDAATNLGLWPPAWGACKTDCTVCGVFRHGHRLEVSFLRSPLRLTSLGYIQQ